MRLIHVALVLAIVAAPLSARAHIKLTAPPSFQVTDVLGNPQKVGPCGEAGTPSNVVTTVEAGSTLLVRWTETIAHPGHFRISIAADAGQLVTPTPVVMQNDCKSAPIENQPALPTLVDGLFPRTSVSQSGLVHSTTVTVPSTPCDRCTLQLMQFMTVHTPPCFYFQCATLRIVAPDAGAGADAGLTTDAGLPVDGGAGGADGGDQPSDPPVGCGRGATPTLALAALAGGLLRRVVRKI